MPAAETEPPTEPAAAPRRPAWAKVVDQTRCIGCHACTTACKSENEVPLSVTRTYVKYVDTGVFPQARRSFQVTRCNQCEAPPCVDACPTSAMFKRGDGIVDFDKSACIGCKACIAACPYDAIFINPDDHSAEKCNFCAHRLDVGLEPACVVVCPTEALLVGDMSDPASEVARIVGRDPVAVRRPEKETRPKLFYKGADQATLDPLAAELPPGGIFMWSEQGDGGNGNGAADQGAASRRKSARTDRPEPGGAAPTGGQGESAPTGPWNSSAAAVLSYDIPHKAPWDFRVSLYTWTKSIAAGAYLAPFLLLVAGTLAPGSGLGALAAHPLWTLGAPVVAGLFLALTGAILVWDLEHPARFHLIFRRPQWRSWLVRGGFIIGGYGLVLAAHFAAAVTGRTPPLWLGGAGALLAVLTAVYTAFLFGQAKARDMWQNPLLPVHFLAQALLAGAGAVALLAIALLGLGGSAGPAGLTGAASAALARAPAADTAAIVAGALILFAAASALHLVMILGEVFMTPPTAHARRAEREMTHGRYRAWFRVGVLGALAGVVVPWLAPELLALSAAAPLADAAGPLGGPLGATAAWIVIPFSLAALLAYEHAYVQAGQSVPLA